MVSWKTAAAKAKGERMQAELSRTDVARLHCMQQHCVLHATLTHTHTLWRISDSCMCVIVLNVNMAI